MVAREPMRARKALLAGAVALALTGTGTALAWSATGTPTPSPSQTAPGKDTAPDKDSAPGQQDKKDQQDKQDKKAQRPQALHGEGVVKSADGTFQTVLEQRGTVESVSDSAITVKSEDGYSQTYAVNADTRITMFPTGDDGQRLKPTDGTTADIAAGDTVRISGTKDGDKAAAKRIVKGAGDGPGLGLGRGHGLGHKMGNGNHQDDEGA